MGQFQDRRLISGENPRYVHDCDKCVFLGTLEETYLEEEYREQVPDFDDTYIHWKEEKEYIDLYAHWDDKEKTLIGRYGNEGSYYFSGIELINSWSKNSERLFVALELAIDKGIIPFYVAYPIELRDKWLRPPEKLSELEPVFSEVLKPFIYQLNTTDLQHHMKASLYQVWDRMKSVGWVDPYSDMPEFRFVSDYVDPCNVTFKWKNQRIAATSKNDYIINDPCPELPPEPDILDINIGYLGKYREEV